MDRVSWLRVIMLMMRRETARTTARMAVIFARSFCMRAPRSALDPPPPPKALVKPVSFESWMRMTAVMRSATMNTMTERMPQTTPPKVISSKIPWIMSFSRDGVWRAAAQARPGLLEGLLFL
jgi:hypothetical protein